MCVIFGELHNERKSIVHDESSRRTLKAHFKSCKDSDKGHLFDTRHTSLKLRSARRTSSTFFPKSGPSFSTHVVQLPQYSQWHISKWSLHKTSFLKSIIILWEFISVQNIQFIYVTRFQDGHFCDKKIILKIQVWFIK